MTPANSHPAEPKVNILLVDDRPENLLTLEEILHDLEQNLVRAVSGPEALHQLLDHDFAVVLLDLQMHGLNGFEIARSIRGRERSPQTPIIFLTARESPDFPVVKAYALGAVDYLHKPLMPEVLKAKVEGFVDLFRKNQQVQRQAEQLRQLERSEFDHRLEEEKQRWELERLRDEARRKNEFLAVLAHELRNPLAPIRNAVQLLRLKCPVEAETQWALDVIERQVQQITRMVDDLLDVSRIAGGKIKLQKEPVEVAAIVARAVEIAQPLIDARRHKLTVALPPEPILLDGDLLRLAQVLANLLNNAAKYTDEGGQIWLAVEGQADELVLRVRDTGVGIPEDFLPQIFDLFAQENRALARTQGGLGIGLTLVRNLVEMHGGSIQAVSPGPGRGSEFIVRLPTSAAGPSPGTAPESLRNDSIFTSSPCHILVVDDNVDAARSLALLLRHSGHDVQTAHDGPSALEAARLLPPDVVLLDIGLPGMDGLEVARRLRRELGLSGALLVAMTGYGQVEDRQRSQAAGFNAHLVKPVALQALAELLAHPELAALDRAHA